jgi:molecular chaperone IbpA
MRLVDSATRVDSGSLAYPPYNIEKTGEDAYRLTMAVAGFSGDELEITVQENALLVASKAKREDEDNRYLHRGIARRAFERRLSLADHIKVVGASLDNGMLHVDPVHEVPRSGKAAQGADRNRTTGAGDTAPGGTRAARSCLTV